MNVSITSNELCARFNKLEWHDSKLRSFAIVRDHDDKDNVVFSLELRGMSEQEFTPATLTLEDATYLRAEVDLEGKSECSDDISSAVCEIESVLKKELLESQLKYSPAALDGYYLFDIYLIPPGGRIQVFARNFRLEASPAY